MTGSRENQVDGAVAALVAVAVMVVSERARGVMLAALAGLTNADLDSQARVRIGSRSLAIS